MNGKRKNTGKKKKRNDFSRMGGGWGGGKDFHAVRETRLDHWREREEEGCVCVSPPPAHDATILFPGVAMTVGSIKGKEEVEEQNRFPIPQPGAPITSRRRGLSGAAARRLGGPPPPYLLTTPPPPALKPSLFPHGLG